MAMQHPIPPRRLEERVSALEDRADTTDERVFGDLARSAAAQQETAQHLGSIDKRTERIEARLEIALDKERAVTDAEIGGLAKRLGELTRRTADDKREMLRRLDELDKDVDASNQHGRETLTSVQRVASDIERQELANKLAAAEKERDAAKSQVALHEAEARDWKKWAIRGAVAALILAAGGLIGWLATRAMPATDHAPRHGAITETASWTTS